MADSTWRVFMIHSRETVILAVNAVGFSLRKCYDAAMIVKKSSRRKNRKTGQYFPNLVPMRAIRQYARQIVERFHPHRIILFGSYAYGTPTPDSDVDLLVVM